MQKNIRINNFLGIDNYQDFIQEIGGGVTADNRYIQHKITLDSGNRDINSDVIGVRNQITGELGVKSMVWRVNDAYPLAYPGVINISKINSIQVIKINKLTLTCRSDYMFNIVKHKKISVLIEEFVMQSFISPEGNNYHFIGSAGLTYEADPSITIQTISFYNHNHGYYVFDKPIKLPNSLTISLFTPFQPLYIDQEILYTVTVIPHSNPITLEFISSHLLFRDTIIIADFTTEDPFTDATLIEAVNQSFTYTQYTIVNSTHIRLNDIDGSTMTWTSLFNVPIRLHIPVQVTLDLEFTSSKE